MLTPENYPWRVGHKVPINVYDGDRPVCQCQTALDAALIVAAVNAKLAADAREIETMRAIEAIHADEGAEVE